MQQMAWKVVKLYFNPASMFVKSLFSVYRMISGDNMPSIVWREDIMADMIVYFYWSKMRSMVEPLIKGYEGDQAKWKNIIVN